MVGDREKKKGEQEKRHGRKRKRGRDKWQRGSAAELKDEENNEGEEKEKQR